MRGPLAVIPVVGGLLAVIPVASGPLAVRRVRGNGRPRGPVP
ncbi:hypothetical protein [Streptosporangium roseum]|nr:hypothetical protein [Streptosporangium roseum]